MENLNHKGLTCSSMCQDVSKDGSEISFNEKVAKKTAYTFIRQNRSRARPLSKALARTFKNIISKKVVQLDRNGLLRLFSNKSGKPVLTTKALPVEDIAAFTRLVIRYGNKAASLSSKKIASKYKLTLDPKSPSKYIFLMKKEEILKATMRNLNAKLEDAMRDVLVDAASETPRPTRGELNKRIRAVGLGVGGVFSPAVAQRIAFTEIASFQNFSTFDAYKQAGIKKIRWISTIDSRTRPAFRKLPRANHILMNGKTTNLGTPFTMEVSNSQMHYPGDPSGLAVDVINCRCTIMPIKTSKR